MLLAGLSFFGSTLTLSVKCYLLPAIPMRSQQPQFDRWFAALYMRISMIA
jgi:hypothetical protein